MNQLKTVHHDIDPVFDARSRVLLLGTMPSPASRTAGFFYGHPQNRFWRVLAALFDEPTPRDTPEKRDLLLRHHIALWDVLASCQIDGASDASIRNAQPNDLRRILSAANIQAIFTTGAKAGELYRKLIQPELDIPCTVLPSTSAANAKMKLDNLVVTYGKALLPYMGEGETRRMLSVPDVAKLEAAIADAGTSLSTLMERAGRALAKAALEEAKAAKASERLQFQTTQEPRASKPSEAPSATNRKLSPACPSASSPKAEPEPSLAALPRIVVLCGSGNNGGDGWVAARELAEAGCKVDLITKYTAEELSAEPAHEQALRTAQYAGSAPAFVVYVAPNNETVAELFSQADIIVDAILGTGFSGDAVRAPYDGWIRLANAQRERGARIVAADVPSGLSAQRGKAAEPCIKAHKTVAMIVSKPGLETPYAFAFCGNVQVAPLAYIEPILEKWNGVQDGNRKETPDEAAKTNQNPRVNATAQPAHAKHDPFRRAETEDDDGYDPYSDRPPAPEPFFEADPWA